MTDKKESAGRLDPATADTKDNSTIIPLSGENENPSTLPAQTSFRQGWRVPMTDFVEQFRQALLAADITPPDVIVPDGKLRRFSTSGKADDDAGWYVLHGDGIPAGQFGCWRRGFSQSWRADVGSRLTPAEAAEYRARVDAQIRYRKQEAAKQHAKAAAKARARYERAKPASDTHDYLKSKGIRAHGVRARMNVLIIPVGIGSDIHSLQFIDRKGRKRFMKGGKVSGCYFLIGDVDAADANCTAEGFATGASLHEATGLPVAVAFFAGNLKHVAYVMHNLHPTQKQIICGDDDWQTKGNPGIAKATEAALAVRAALALPRFDDSRPYGATDFNDMAALYGLEAVRQAVMSATSAGMGLQHGFDTPGSNDGVTGVTKVRVNDDADEVVTPDGSGEVAEVTQSLVPDEAERPCFRVFEETVVYGGFSYRQGVWHFGADKDGNPTQTWVCSPLYVVAITYDAQGNNFGRMVRFENTIGQVREWAMPMEMLRGSGDELRGELLAMGVEISPELKVRNLLSAYLLNNRPARQMRCALQVGWHDGSFVLPDVVIGPNATEVIFQSGERGHDEYTTAGTVDGWKAEIAVKAVGNPFMVIAISSAFVGPLLRLCNAEGGGYHFFGVSSTGKTTLIRIACSVWGGPTYHRSWRSTANGMEGVAALFNDGLLALDEISECDPKDVGAIVYALGNGRGKQRASRTGAARAITRWRCSIISSGEFTIATAMQEGGHRPKAGQAVRVLDIPVARAHGAWDDLHGLPSGAAFSDTLIRAATVNYGHPGRAFLEKLTIEDGDFCANLERIKALPQFVADPDEGQDKRAAARFALLAFAGELATKYGLTGWPKGEAVKAAAEGYRLWREQRGQGNAERRQILAQVASFIERHGDSRFSDADDGHEEKIHNRAGWWQSDQGSRVYLFTSAGMNEALKGFEFRHALDVLQKAGALPPPDKEGKRAHATRIKSLGRDQIRLYRIDPEKLERDYA